jgi:DNA-binding NarL/FixJ family response regulator
MKRIVIVADNSLIVEAIRAGLRRSGEFHLVGHADPGRTSAATIIGASPDVVLLDVAGSSQSALELIRSLKLEDDQVAVIVLGVEMAPEWLDRVFDAGATCAISKATNPVALATLLRETLSGHIFHPFAQAALPDRQQTEVISSGDLPLTRREFEILQLVAAGSTNGDVARKLWVTEQTVKFHLRNIYRKLDVANRTEASHFAYMNGLLGADRTLTAVS